MELSKMWDSLSNFAYFSTIRHNRLFQHIYYISSSKYQAFHKPNALKRLQFLKSTANEILHRFLSLSKAQQISQSA